jgi:hypothetical protein
VILSNGNIFIGISAENRKQIIIEEIANADPPRMIAVHKDNVSALLADEAQNVLWAGDEGGNVFQYVRLSTNGWKIQAKYPDFGIGEILCLSRFGHLLFVGSLNCKVHIINTADKQVLPKTIETTIAHIHSLQICQISPSKTYLAVIGEKASFSKNTTDIFNISKFQQMTVAKKVFSKPESHIKSILTQFNENNFSEKKPSTKDKISKLKTPSHENS